MSTLKIYNTMGHSFEEFIPGGTKKDKITEYPPVTIYSCGPTVYSYAHIGNFRTFIYNDLLRRYLKYRGFKVDHTMNITDVDDKTIKGSIDSKTSLKEFTEKYTNIFFEDLKTLNIEPVEHYPRATDSIDAMNEIINKLNDKGLVYEKDGSLYFSISKFENYGRLSNIESREVKAGARCDADEYEKDDVRDFALWKASKENEPKWKITLGEGRPGWHIECSAMVRKIYGSTIDIHTGGVDLIFPHHENEIAQSEAAYGEKFSRYWTHSEHLLVEGTKMSKSKGNFYTLHSLLDKGFSPRSIRFLLLSAHYRKQLNFTLDGLKSTEAPLERIDNFLVRIKDLNNTESNIRTEYKEAVNHFEKSFIETMDDDFNISGGTGQLFEFITKINSLISSNGINKEESSLIEKLLKEVDGVFGYIFFPANNAIEVDVERIEKLIIERRDAKQNKNFKRSDEIREMLLAEGIVLEDGKDGTRWKIKK